MLDTARPGGPLETALGSRLCTQMEARALLSPSLEKPGPQSIDYTGVAARIPFPWAACTTFSPFKTEDQREWLSRLLTASAVPILPIFSTQNPKGIWGGKALS